MYGNQHSYAEKYRQVHTIDEQYSRAVLANMLKPVTFPPIFIVNLFLSKA